MTTEDASRPEIERQAAERQAAERQSVLRLTYGQWRRLLEDRSFLEDADNRFQPPRRYRGRLVEIVPQADGAS